MLSEPQHGWTFVQIEDFKEPASYITDVPNDCLDGFIYALNNNLPAIIYFDAEGYDYYLIITRFVSYIILEKESVRLYRFEISMYDLVEELINDIELYIDEWASWGGSTDKKVKRNKEILEQKIIKLKQLLN